MIIQNKKTIIRAAIVIVSIVCVFASLSSGYYVDENGLLAIYRGIFRGQRMFVDSWEALQTGAFLMYPIFALYSYVLAPVLAKLGIGLVMYTRILYVLCRLAVACYLYFTLRRSDYKKGAFAASIIYFLFVVGWWNFSYKSFCDMAIVLIICYILRYYETEKPYYMALVGLMCSVAVLAYPTMLIMAVALGVGLIIAIRKEWATAKALWFFIGTCVVCAVGFLIYLQCTSGIVNALGQLQYLGDQDYDYSLPVRLARMLVKYIAFAVIAYVPIVAINIFKKYRYMTSGLEQLILCAYWIVFMLGICLARVEGISTSRFVYGLLILFFWFPYLVYEKKDDEYTEIGSYSVSSATTNNVLLWIIFTISAVAQLIWAVSTNQDISVPGHMALYGVLAEVLFIAQKKKAMQLLIDFVIAVCAFFAIIWVPESNGGFAHVFETRYYLTEGPLAGVCVTLDYNELSRACYELTGKYVQPGDYLMVTFGSNSPAYLGSYGEIAGHTVYDRTQVNTKVLDFWTVHPEKTPKYVLINEANSKYSDFVAGKTGEYILSNYTVEVERIGDVVLLTHE